MSLRNLLVFIALVLLVVIFPAIRLYGDWLWFSALGFSGVFLTILSTKLILGIAAALIVFFAIIFNIRFAKRKKKQRIPRRTIILVGIIALLAGVGFSAGWETVLKYTNSTLFGMADPVFDMDVGFYAFALPFYFYVLGFAGFVIAASLIGSFLSYVNLSAKSGEFEEEKSRGKPLLKHKLAKKHLSFLLGLLFVVIAVWLFLERFNVLFSARGAVFGAGFTDLNVHLPLLYAYAVLAAIVALVFFIGMRSDKWRLQKLGIILLVAAVLIGSGAEVVVQQFVVSPDEFNLEKDFLERNIDFTRSGYKLDTIDERPFPVSLELSREDLEKNRVTLDNVRLWDFRPLLRTYSQLQIFRTYYDFNGVDIDRYMLDGKLKQVMLSARELNQRNLDPQARTWVNRHLVFTHGYGIILSPVEQVSKEGLPVFLVKDIPPQSSLLEIERPEVYYGELTDDFVVVRTTTEELDYPSGDINIYTTYEGSGGVELSSLNRLVYAIKFNSIELLVSGSIKDNSRILFNRNIVRRAREIAPFLKYDADPYIVIADGKLFWIYDAYTTTDRYPYSEPSGEFNYIRNSVKITIDAYTGDVTFYIIDSSDPVVNTYRKMFPGMFRDFSEMPGSLKEHIRYPEGLFSVQADIYSVYHMKDSRVFYNKEDVWEPPQEIYRGSKQELIPYYVILKLPGEEKEEFILMLPFTPRNKDNMIGWMAARSDGENYGKLSVFMFSKQELIFGPLQVEARIDQDTDISQLITLWSQSGSDVIRANLLVIPVENSILYIEPVYLQASETGALPEFKRVVVAFGNRLTMKETLEEALDVIFGEKAEEEMPAAEKTKEDLISEANVIYQRAQGLLKQGDLAGYAREIEKLGEVLNKLGSGLYL